MSDQPLRDVLFLLTHSDPPEFVRGYSLVGLTEVERDQLREWCWSCLVLNRMLPWADGDMILEAAQLIVKMGVHSGRLAPDGMGLQIRNPEALTIAAAEDAAIATALSIVRGNKRQAAKILGIARETLHKKLQRRDKTAPSDGE